MLKNIFFLENTLMNVFSQILLISLMSVGVIILILLFKAVFRNKLSAKYHYYIWVILIVRLIVPFNPTISFHNKDFYLTNHKSNENYKDKGVMNEQNIIKISSLSKTSSSNYIVENNTNLNSTDKNEVNSYIKPLKVSYNKAEGILLICSKIWFFGFLLLILYIIIINSILKFKINKTRVLINDMHALSILEECKKLLKININISIVVQKHIKAPAIYGTLIPKILIPDDVMEKISSNELRYIILHELCHYKRKDLLVGMLQMILCVFHWFNPFLWYALFKIKEDREPLCDNMVLSYITPQERKGYAETLLKILKCYSESHWVYSTANMSIGSLSSMEWRLKLMKAVSKRSFKIGVFALILVTLLGLVSGMIINNSIGPSIKVSATQSASVGEPKRGTITDRNGNVLAIDIRSYFIFLDLIEIKESDQNLIQITKDLGNILNLPQDYILGKANKPSRKSSRYEVVKSYVDVEVGDKVKEWIEDGSIKGVIVEEVYKRYYPKENLAAHVVGFTGNAHMNDSSFLSEDTIYRSPGLAGIERVMDNYLKSVPDNYFKSVTEEKPFNHENQIENKGGLNVVLTIDETIQYIASKALDKVLEDYKGLNGAAIIMDPRNGDILAMVSKPDFDLNNERACPSGVEPSTWKGNTTKDIETLIQTVWKNRCIQGTFEPGSTFSTITLAAGFEEGLVTPETMTSDKTIMAEGYKIDCHQPNFHGVESLREAFYNSCNPVFAKVALDLGINKFYKYVKAFGFYDRTGIYLYEEEINMINKEPKIIDMVTASFGENISVTPIELITAYSTIANNGKMMKPQILRKVLDARSRSVKVFEPEEVRNVISKETAFNLKVMLREFAEKLDFNGNTNKYKMAGISGSNVKENGRVVSSFAGFAPYDNPEIVCVIIIDDLTINMNLDKYKTTHISESIMSEVLDYLHKSADRD